MTAADRFLIKAQRSDYSQKSDDFKVYFRSTLQGARGLAKNLLRKLGEGHEVCIFDLTLREIVPGSGGAGSPATKDPKTKGPKTYEVVIPAQLR